MTAEEWEFGAPVRGHRWRPAGTARANLLLAHGFGEYAQRYVGRHNALIPALVGRGFAVHAFDLEGHGGSAGRRGSVDLRRAVEQHRAARRALTGRPLCLMGHSLGGLLTAASVVRDGAGLAGVVLSAPALPTDAPLVTKVVGRLLARVAPHAGILPALDPAGISRIEAEVDAYRTDPGIYRGKLPAITGATALAVSQATWAGLGDWRAPVLAIHGTADTFTDPAGSERLIAAAPAADKTLTLFEGGRHELLNDLERDRALTLVLDWLEARAAI